MKQTVDITGIAIALCEFSETNGLLRKSFDGCNISIDNCIKDDNEAGIKPFGGFARENIRITFHSQTLVINHFIYHSPCFKTRLSLFNNNGTTENFDEMTYIGFYELDTDENGNYFDDWLVLDE